MFQTEAKTNRNRSDILSASSPISSLGILQSIKYAARLLSDSLPVMDELEANYGSLVRLAIPGKPTYFLFDADYVIQTLANKGNDVVKSVNYSEFKPLLGTGLLTSDGDLWERQRQYIQPEFSLKKLKSYDQIINKNVFHFINHLTKKNSHSSFEVSRPLMQLTFQILGEIIFGMDFSGHADLIQMHFPEVADYYMKRVFLNVPTWLPLPRHFKAQNSLKKLDGIVNAIISQELESVRMGNNHHNNFLSSMLLQHLQNPDSISIKQIRDEVMTFILAGHETTSNTVAWTLHLLSQNALIQDKAHEEVSTICKNDFVSFDDYKNLSYIRQVIMESMRLYPPAYLISRGLTNNKLAIADCEFEKNAVLMIPIWRLHRTSRYWPDPLVFDPNRFDSENFTPAQKKAYIPFGAGKRRCIGSELGMIESVIICALLLKYLKFTPDYQNPVKIHPSLTLRPKDGLFLKIERIAT